MMLWILLVGNIVIAVVEFTLGHTALAHINCVAALFLLHVWDMGRIT